MARSQPSDTDRPVRSGRRGLRILASLLLLGALLLTLLIAAVQSHWGVRTVAGLALGAVNPWKDSRLIVSDTRGGLLTGLTLLGVELRGPGGVARIHVDTLRLDYRWRELLESPHRARGILLAGASIVTVKHPHENFDLLAPFLGSPRTPKKKGPGFGLTIDSATIRRTRIEARFPDRNRDSVVEIADLGARLHALRFNAPATTMTLDTLDARGRLLDPPAFDVRLAARADWQSDRVQISSLRLLGPRTWFEAVGTVPDAGWSSENYDRIGFHAALHPLSGDEFRRWLGFAWSPADLNGEVDVKGRDSTLAIAGEARAGNGRVSFQAAGTPSTAGPIRIGAKASAAAFDLGVMLGQAPGQLLLSGRLDTDLGGPDLARVSGPFSLMLDGSRIHGVEIARGRLEAPFESGRAAVQADGAAAGFELSTRGTIVPFGRPPSYDLRAMLDIPPLGGRDATGRPRRPFAAGRLSARLEGRGVNPRDADSRLEASLEPDREARPRIGASRLELSCSRGISPWKVHSELADGTLDANGRIEWGPVAHYSIDRGELRGIHLAALLGDSLPSRLDARIRLEGRGLDPISARATADLDSLSLEYGRHRIERGSAHLELRAGNLAGNGTAPLDGADVGWSGSIEPISPPLRRARFQGSFQRLDLARVLGDTTWSSSLAGRLTVQARAPDLLATLRALQGPPTRPGDVHAEANLTLEPSRWRSERISALEASAKLEALDATLEGRLESSFARARFSAQARPFDERRSATLVVLEFSNLDLSRALPAKGPSTDLRGTLAGHVSGRDSTDLAADYRLTLDGSHVQRATFDQLASSGTLASGKLDARLHARSGADRLEVTAGGSPFLAQRHAEFRGRAEIANLGAWLGRELPRTSTRIAFELAVDRGGAGPSAWGASGRLEGNANVGEARLDTIATEFSLSRGLMRVPRLHVRGNVATLDASGQWAAAPTSEADSTRLDVTGVAQDLAPLAPLLGAQTLSSGTARIRLHAEGPAAATRFNGDVVATRPHYNNTWADSVGISFIGLARDSVITAIDARLDARSLVVWPLAARDLTSDLHWDGHELSSQSRAVVDADRSEELAFRLWPTTEERRVRLERLELQSHRMRYSLARACDVELGRRLHVDQFVLLENGRPCVSIDGGIDSSSAADLRLRLDSLSVLPILEPIGMTAISGRLSAQASLTGTRARPSLATTFRSSLATTGQRPARIDGGMNWNADSLAASLAFVQKANQRLSFRGRLPLRLSLAGPPPPAAGATPVSARLEVVGFDISWFEPLFSKREVRKLRGSVDGTVEASGELDRPDLTGTLALTGAGVELPNLGTKFEKGEAQLGLENRIVRLDRARIRSGKGELTASGQLEFQGRAQRVLDLKADWKGFTFMNTLQAKVESSGNLTARGPLNAPRVEGLAQLDNSTFYAEAGERTRKAERVELTEADRRDLQERFGYGVEVNAADRGSWFDSTDTDLRVHVGRNVWVRRRSDPILSLEMQGDVRTLKRRGRDFEAQGQLGIQTGRSYLSFLGRQFEITRAQVELPGPMDSARAEIEAHYNGQTSSSSSGGATVTAIVRVDATGASVDLRSDPFMDHASLLNYLATGQTQGEMASGSAYGLAVGSVLGAVGGAAGRSLGFQVVQVSQDAFGGQTLSAGNYVDPRLYLGFRQPVVQGQRTNQTSQGGTYSTEFEVELEVLKQLLLNLQGGGSQYRFLLRPRLGN